MATDPDPYFALPKLYGAPAYARPPRVVEELERPLDPDDLPIAAEQTAEERALANELRPSGVYRPGPGHDAGGWGGRPGGPGAGRGRRLSLRTIADRLGAGKR